MRNMSIIVSQLGDMIILSNSIVNKAYDIYTYVRY